MTTPEQFQAYLAAAEGTRIEFKEAKSNFHFDELVRYCVALANEGGGKILFGVTDRRPRTVVGTQAFAEPGRTEAGLYDRLQRRIPVEEYFHQGQQRVLIVHVPARLRGSAWNDKGVFWMRAGDALLGMNDEQLRQIYAEIDSDFSAEICGQARPTDLDPAAIDLFRSLWAKRTNNQRLLTLSDEQLLTDAELLVDGGITYAALLLFGTHRALGRLLGQAEVIFEYRSSEASGPAQDRAEYRLGFLLFHDLLWERINLRNDRQSYQDGLFRFEIATFDEAVIREAVLNAVCHRDYRLGGSVFVRQYARRLEVVSPGGFPAGVTTENILDQQNPRNRRLAEAYAKCGLVERSGQGMNLMFERSIRQSKPLPDFQGTSAYDVRLTLHGTVGNPAFIRFLERIGQAQLQSFSTHDFLILDSIHHERTVPENLRPMLKRLVNLGIIETIGRGRSANYILSRSLYDALGQPATYTRRKGLDRLTNKELLVKHLEYRAPDGCALDELQLVLPHVARRTIQLYLTELRDEGRIRLAGKNRGGLWYLEQKNA
ncbi:MAG: transcriptional regulator [Caldilinea sp. CFX5]|nr:transcriptional regulator [Caldilinea sp. CFX5]